MPSLLTRTSPLPTNYVDAKIDELWAAIGGVTPQEYGAVGGTGLVNDTQAFVDMIAALPARHQFVRIPPGTYLIDPIDWPIDNTYVFAGGAQFVLNSTGVAFNFNPDADPADVEGTAKSYGFWSGGKFTSNQSNPASTFAAFQVFGIRQMVIENVVFGTAKDTNGGSTATLTDGIRVGGLGAHLFRKNRFYLVDKAIHGPDWTGGLDTTSTTLTTSTFECNEFVLGQGDSAIYLDGGWERISIIGGFTNGARDAAAMYFSNRKGTPRGLRLIGVNFEQAVQDSQFVLVEDLATGKTVTDIYIAGCEFNGDPAAGGHTHMAFERTQRIELDNVYTTALVATGNTAVSMDANCKRLTVNPACRMVDPSLVTSSCLDINASVPREGLRFPNTVVRTNLALTGYAGASFSTRPETLDMSSLITGDRYPLYGIPPAGYHLHVELRDSGSAGASAVVKFGRTSTDIGNNAFLNVCSLAGVANDNKRTFDFFQCAHTDGSVYIDITATGASTLDLWIYLREIVNG